MLTSSARKCVHTPCRALQRTATHPRRRRENQRSSQVRGQRAPSPDGAASRSHAPSMVGLPASMADQLMGLAAPTLGFPPFLIACRSAEQRGRQAIVLNRDAEARRSSPVPDNQDQPPVISEHRPQPTAPPRSRPTERCRKCAASLREAPKRIQYRAVGTYASM